MFYWIGFIMILSIGLALWSYRKEQDKREVHKVKEDLKKGKVIFHSSSAGSSSSSKS